MYLLYFIKFSLLSFRCPFVVCKATKSWSDENSVGFNEQTKSYSDSSILNENVSATDFTNSMKVAWSLLEMENLIVPKPCYAIDHSARVIGKGLCDLIKLYFKENVLSTEEDSILFDEQVDSSLYVQVDKLFVK